ncbi:MAG: hypothetical protein K6A34_07335 [Methanobrevibacter sp.]|nr:hypothetical protein [Methanobrevibacter sp.]
MFEQSDEKWYLVLNEKDQPVAIIKNEETTNMFLMDFEHNGRYMEVGFTLNFDRYGNITGYLDRPIKREEF